MADGSKAQSAAYLAAVAAAERLYADPAELNAFMAERLNEDEQRVRIGPFADKYRDTPDTLHGNGHDQGCESIGCTDSSCYCGASPCNCGTNERILAEAAAKREHLRMWVEQRATLKDVYANPGQYLHDQKIVLVASVAMLECVVRMDAAIYDQHPEFKPEWRLP